VFKKGEGEVEIPWISSRDIVVSTNPGCTLLARIFGYDEVRCLAR
jgi:hypothetical protein